MSFENESFTNMTFYLASKSSPIHIYSKSKNNEKIEKNSLQIWSMNEKNTTMNKINSIFFADLFPTPKGILRLLYLDVMDFVKNNDYNISDFEKLDMLCMYLISLGYIAKIKKNSNLQTNYYTNLKHEFIIVNDDDYEVIIDIFFKEQFMISRPSERYQNLLSYIPLIYIGSMEQLVKNVDVISQEIAVSFFESKLHLPPWRKRQSLLSKWK